MDGPVPAVAVAFHVIGVPTDTGIGCEALMQRGRDHADMDREVVGIRRGR